MAATPEASSSLSVANLGSPSASKRIETLAQMAERPQTRHLGAICATLGDPSVGVRLRAVDALLSLAQAHPRPRGTVRRVLTRCLRDDASSEVKRRSAAALLALDACDAAAQPGPAAPAPAAPAAAAPRGRGRRSTAAVRAEGKQAIEQGTDQEYDGYHDYRDYDDEAPAGPLPSAEPIALTGEVEATMLLWTARLHRDAPEPAKVRVGNLLTPGAYRKLQGLVRPSSDLHFASEVDAFLRFHGLRYDPTAAAGTLPALALRPLLRLHELATLVPPDWAALEEPLLGALRAPPPSERALEAIVLAFHEAAAHGPDELRETLARAVWHDGWAPLACWLLSAEENDWLERARLARGSSLAQRCLREAAAGRRSLSVSDVLSLRLWAHSPSSVDAMLQLLQSGGGSLRSLDYPELRVVSRAALVELQPEQERELAQLCTTLCRFRKWLDAPHTGLVSLLHELAPALWGALGAGVRSSLVDRLQRSTLAYVHLRRDPALAEVRLRRSHLIEFWLRPEKEPGARSAPERSFAQVRSFGSDERVLEGIVLALLSELHQPYTDDEAQRAALKELLIEAARAVAACYAWVEPPWPRSGDVAAASRLIDALLRCFDHAPRELAQGLGLDPQQGLPRLRGGQASALEARFRKLHREALRGRRGGAGGAGSTYTLRPLPKQQALNRGELGRDCSSSSVPLRALSPHHVYYGIFDDQGEQMPGYLTVYEAWGRADDGDPRPVLCLETINEPRGLLAGAQQDLLLLFEAVARHRGLSSGLVLITDHGTWNYSNGTELARCRRARQGKPILLSPADPVVWRIYEQRCPEARYYSAFDTRLDGLLLRPDGDATHRAMVLLAPFDPALDPVQPETLDEVRRIDGLSRRALAVTCRGDEGEVVGFISC